MKKVGDRIYFLSRKCGNIVVPSDGRSRDGVPPRKYTKSRTNKAGKSKR